MFDNLLIHDMIDACEAMMSFTKDFSREEILSNDEKMAAIYFNFQIVGEAAGRLSYSLKDDHPSIPWRKYNHMRHKIVHQYAWMDEVIILELVEVEIPILLKKMRTEILQEFIP